MANTPIDINSLDMPWEQLPNEGDKPFEAFKLYRELGTNRSYREVAERLQKSETIIGRWGRNYHWGDRIRAWENEVERQASQKLIKDIANMRARQAKQALTMQLKGMQFIKNLNFDEKQGEVSDVKLSEIVQLMRYASETERICMGDVGEVVEERNGGDTIPAVQVYIPSNGRDGSVDGDE